MNKSICEKFKCINCNSARKGFTLAEILVVITVIGIIAMQTIPPLVTNIQDTQYRTAWKKNFAVFSQATISILQDKGTIQGICSGTENHNCIKDLYLPYLSYVKACNDNSTLGQCWHNNGGFTYLDGTPAVFGDDAGVILKDGTIIDFYHWTKDCTHNVWANTPICGCAFLDINGFRKPNKFGKDIYGFLILPDRIKPLGSGDDFDNKCEGSTGTSSGNGCSTKYLTQ